MGPGGQWGSSPHHKPSHKRVQGEHLPPPQEDLYHDQGQVCQGAAPDQGQDLILVIAHTRQKMLRTITSLHHLPHLLSNNQQTSLSDRLLTGSLSNQDQATYYPRQLNSSKNTVLFSSEDKLYDPELNKEFSRIILFKDPK